jgi:glycosyltransferase involved in cell wall biosynthesis
LLWTRVDGDLSAGRCRFLHASDTAFPPFKRDYYLAASQWVPYKRIDLIVAAFREMPDRRLIVAAMARGRANTRCQRANTEFVGHVSRGQLRDLMRGARAFVFAAEEDFGILPVEAQACGTPVIAFAAVALRETVRGLDDADRRDFLRRAISGGNCRAVGSSTRPARRRPGRLPVECRTVLGPTLSPGIRGVRATGMA